ncbi:MAG: hypothetical protein AB8G95_16545 [Anaerolineae bacterium]
MSRKYILTWTAIAFSAILFSVLQTTWASSGDSAVNVCGGLSQEAENGQFFGEMQIGNDKGASGGKYVFTSESVGENATFENNPHKVEFCIEVPQGGDYQINTWVNARNSSHDSMFVAIDGEPSAGYLWDVTLSNGFIKDTVRDRGKNGPKTITLSKGTHTLTFSNREPDTKLDRFEVIKVGGLDPEVTIAPTLVPTEAVTQVPTQIPPTQTPNAESCGGLEQEAELAALFGGMTVGTDSKASGGKFIYTSSEHGKSTKAIAPEHRAEFCVEIEEAGDYEIMGWVKAADQESDSFYVTVDNAPAQGYLWDPKRSDEFTEDLVNDRGKSDPQIVYFSKGEHVVAVYHREPNTQLDKIKLSLVSGSSQPATPTVVSENPTATPVETTPTAVLPTATATATSVPVSTCGGMIQEAELAILNGGMSIGTDSSASGGKFIYTPTGFGKSTKAIDQFNWAEFCVTIPEDGEYKIIGRAQANDINKDSFYVTIDNGPAKGYLWDIKKSSTFINDEINDRGKTDPQIIRLTAGEHSLKIYNREPGTLLDRIEFVQLSGGGVPIEPTVTEIAPTLAPTIAPPVATPTEVNNACGGLLQEAEAASLYGQMAIGSSSSASGGKYVSAPSSAGESSSASAAEHRVDFCVTITEPGGYRIIGRVQTNNSGRDSFFVVLDGNTAESYLWDVRHNDSFVNDEVNNRKKADPQLVLLGAGEHTISIINREPGVKLDRIELVKVSGSAPVQPTPTKTPVPVATATSVPPTVTATQPPVATSTPVATATATAQPGGAICGGLEQEAENATLFGGMTVGYDGGASGGRFIFVSSSRGNALTIDQINRAEFCITVPATGEYQIEALVKAVDGGSDSFYVTVDQAPAAGYLWDVTHNSKFVSDYVNDRGKSDPQIIFLSQGEHIVSVHHREPGTQLDKIKVVLAADSGGGGVIPQPTTTPVSTVAPPTATPIANGNGNVYYVSRNGNNANGQSWATAWNELSRINWSVLKAGDTVYIDGGSSSMTYRTTLKPAKSGTSDKPILLQLSAENGRNGQAIFFGGNRVPLPECGVKSWNDSQHKSAGSNAIYFDSGISNIIVDGRKMPGIVIHGWKSNGIQFNRNNTRNITLRYMEIYNNGGVRTENDGGVQIINPSHSDSGIEFAGVGHKFHFMRIHDNSADAIQSASAYNNMDNFELTDSWLYNQRPHSGSDNSPSSDICTSSNRSGCDEYGAPQMGPDYWNYPNTPRREAFNWCTHSDGVQIYTGNDFNTMTIKRTIIGPNFMTGLILGDRNSSSTTAWVNNLTLEDVVITRFMHNGLGMKNPADHAGENWRLKNVTIYGHQSNTQKGALQMDWSRGSNHVIEKTVMVYGEPKFADGHVTFNNNCEWNLYNKKSIGGQKVDPKFKNINGGDVFEPNLNVDFATVFKDDYTPTESRCSGLGSGTYSVSKLLSNFNR